MPKLASEGKCTGCAACQAACPAHAIRMKADDEGFDFPHVDAQRCAECGVCEKRCPVLHPAPRREPLAVYGAKARDESLRLKSSSGGIFSYLAHQILEQEKGVVYGAAWERPSMRVVHTAVQRKEDLDELRRSKYVQSDLQGVYGDVRAKLENGHKVLFSGCPCQIAGVKSFLGKDFENLLCVDVACHGVASPLVFKRYKDGLQAKFESPLTSISFRNKDAGWHTYSVEYHFLNNQKMITTSDVYLNGYFSNLYARQCCSRCAFRELRSGADITLADFWGVEKLLPLLADDKGVSLVLLNTDKGQKLFLSEKVNHLTVLESSYTDAYLSNAGFILDGDHHPNRAKFFQGLKQKTSDHDLPEYIRAMLEYTVLYKCWNLLIGYIKFFPKKIVQLCGIETKLLRKWLRRR